MSSDLRARLGRLPQPSDSQSRTTPLRKALRRDLQRNRERSIRRLDGYWQETDQGKALLLDRFYPTAQEHAGVALRDFLQLSEEPLQTLSGAPHRFLDFAPDRTLFFDTETTGLAGGAGTYLFLLGLGFFEGDQFVVRQFLLPAFEGESAQLRAFDRLLQERRFQSLVTFNGKSFDLNLLENRLVLNGLGHRLEQIDHLDLLHPSRLLWKRSLGDCSLQSLERHVLRMFREGDVPSAMIPRLFFQFAHSGDGSCLRPVLRHNRLDILSMLSLCVVASSLLSQPDMDRHVEALDLSRFHRTRGHRRRAIHWLERALPSLPPRSNQHQEAQLSLADLLRRCGRYEAALPLYLEILEQRTRPPLEALEGAAKILEHRHGDLDTALRIVERGLEIHPEPGLQHRCFRLRCRIEGKRWY